MASQPVILIIEDNPVLQEIYLEQFTAAHFTVIQAFDGVEALELAEKHPDISVMMVDIMLPRLSGYEVIKKIRHTALSRDIPILVVSALESETDQQRGITAGANEYLPKGEIPLTAIIEKARRYAGR